MNQATNPTRGHARSETSRDQASSDMKDRFCEASHNVEGMIKKNAATSAAIAFGLGIGAGIAIAALIGESTRSRHSSLAHRLGDQVLSSVHSALPDRMWKR